MNVDKEQFKKMFPNLAKEMEECEEEETLEPSAQVNTETEKEEKSERFDGYDPCVTDFLRRCDNEQQAEEIIAYLEKKGEINREYAARLRRQLKNKGVRSFGAKKEDSYYLKQAGL